MAEKYADTVSQQGENALAIAKTQPGQALKTVLKDLPVREKNASKHLGDAPPKDDPNFKNFKKESAAAFKECKDVAAKAVLDVIFAIDPKVMDKAVAELDDEERDTLMKFVYRGFATPESDHDYGLLIKCHESIYKVSGTGPIIRSIHTRLEV